MKTVLFRCGGIFFGLLVSWVAAEAALWGMVRWAGPDTKNAFVLFMRQVKSNPGDSPIFRASRDPALGVEFVPGARQGGIRINRDGFRGPDYPREAPEGKKRIVVLGDSETFCASLSESEAFPGALETLLNEKAGAPRYEVLNAGVPAYNTFQECHFLKSRLMGFHPSVVVLYYVLNDPMMEDRYLLLSDIPFSWSSTAVFLAWLRGNFRTFSGIGEMQRASRDIVDFYGVLHRSPYFERCQKIIRETAADLSANGVRFFLVIAPSVDGYEDFRDFPYREIHGRLLGLASKDVTVVDPTPDLAALGKKPKAFWVTPFDCHKNAEANRAVARSVASAVWGGRSHPRSGENRWPAEF